MVREHLQRSDLADKDLEAPDLWIFSKLVSGMSLQERNFIEIEVNGLTIISHPSTKLVFLIFFFVGFS